MGNNPDNGLRGHSDHRLLGLLGLFWQRIADYTDNTTTDYWDLFDCFSTTD